MTFFDSLSTFKKTAIFAVIVLLFSGLLYFVHGKFIGEISIIFVFIFLVIFCKSIWLSEDNSKVIQKCLFGLALAIIASYNFWNSYIDNLLGPILKYYVKGVPKIENLSSPISIILSLFLIGLISFWVRDNTVMREHSGTINKEFPDKSFANRLSNFTRVLRNYLENIDIEINWNDYYFTPLEAEVEVINSSTNKKIKRVTDLLKAIKSDYKSQVFLIIGDPGSGKSTALRKLAGELLKEINKTGKVPVYINLKDWQSNKTWTIDSPPTAIDIYDFVVDHLKKRGDIFANEFIDDYFKKMHENGRLFFLLDSFDEIPEILDADENSWIVDAFSDAFYTFLAGATESRGILSSRIFRKPTAKFKTKTTLELRPFSEAKIEQSFLKALSNLKPNFFREFFKSHSDLIPIARNPFSAALIIQYLKENNMNFPKNQYEIYNSYIKKRLSKCEENIKKNSLSIDEIIDFTTNLSFYIFSTQKLGLEIKIEEVYRSFPRVKKNKIDAILSILVYAKIARQGVQDKKFSFVHRRFNEYFVVLKFIQEPANINFQSIPNDSRWRDALVLYCEVAGYNEAVKIANFCWQTISEIDKPNDLRSIHCVRFLNDAFKGRTECIEEFRDELAKFITKQIEPNKNIISAKLAIESVGLLKDSDINSVIIKAINLKIDWLEQEAIKSCKYISTVNEDLEGQIIQTIYNIDIITFLEKYSDLKFSFSLSEGFSSIQKKIELKYVECLVTVVINVITFLFYPLMYLLSISSFLLICFLFIYILRVPNEDKSNLEIEASSKNVTSSKVDSKIKQHIYLKYPVRFLLKLVDFNLTMLVKLLPLCISIICFNSPAEKFVNPFNLNSHHLGVILLCINILSLFNFSKIINLDFRIEKEEYKKYFYGIMQFGLLGILYIGMGQAIEKLTHYVKPLHLITFLCSIMVIIFFPAAIKNHIQYFRLKNFYKNVNFDKLNEREYIYEVFTLLNASTDLQNKILRYLETNVNEVIGNWPDENFLVISENQQIVRIARLEEKWLKLNK